MVNINSIGKKVVAVFLFNVVMAFIYMGVSSETEKWGSFQKKYDIKLIDKFINRYYYAINITTFLGSANEPNDTLSKFITICQIFCVILFLPFILSYTW